MPCVGKSMPWIPTRQLPRSQPWSKCCLPIWLTHGCVPFVFWTRSSLVGSCADRRVRCDVLHGNQSCSGVRNLHGDGGFAEHTTVDGPQTEPAADHHRSGTGFSSSRGLHQNPGGSTAWDRRPGNGHARAGSCWIPWRGRACELYPCPSGRSPSTSDDSSIRVTLHTRRSSLRGDVILCVNR